MAPSIKIFNDNINIRLAWKSLVGVYQLWAYHFKLLFHGIEWKVRKKPSIFFSPHIQSIDRNMLGLGHMPLNFYSVNFFFPRAKTQNHMFIGVNYKNKTKKFKNRTFFGGLTTWKQANYISAYREMSILMPILTKLMATLMAISRIENDC